MRGINWLIVIIGILVALAVAHTTRVYAAVVPPALNETRAGFHSPSPPRQDESFFERQPYWSTVSGKITTSGWTVAYVNEELELRATVNKVLQDWGVFRQTTLGIDVQQGDDPPLSFSGNWNNDASQQRLSSQFGLTYRTERQFISGEFDNNNIRYGVRTPNVTAPTWFTFQIWLRFTNANGSRTLYSRLGRILVIPFAYAPALTSAARVLFPDQNALLAVAGLEPTVIPDYALSSPAYLRREVVGNQLRITSTGAVGETVGEAGLQLAPLFGDAPPAIFAAKPVTIYTARLADQQVYDGQPATLRLQLPEGLEATDVRWFVDGHYQATGSELRLARVTTRVTVEAVGDFYHNGELVAAGVRSNAAEVTVLPPRTDYHLAFDQPFLFASVGAASALGRTDQLRASVVGLPADVMVQWRLTSAIAQVDATGLVTATAATGSVEVIAEFVVDGVWQRAVRRLEIVQLADTSLPAGRSGQLNATALAALWPPGTAVSYSWHVATANAALTGAPVAVSPVATYALANVSSAQNGSTYQLVMRATVAGQVQTVVSNVATIAVIPPPGLALQVVPNFNFALAGGRSPTVEQVIAGVGILPNATGVRQLVVSDNRAVAGEWQLTVALSEFVSIRELTPLSQRVGDATLNLQVGGTTVSPVQAGGSPVVVRTDTARVAAWDVVGTLALAPIAAPGAGGYGAQLHWQLTAGPTAAAP